MRKLTMKEKKVLIYPPSQKTMGLPVDECANVNATTRCRPKIMADNRVVAEGEDGYFNGTKGLPVGLHYSDGKLYITKVFERKLFFGLTVMMMLWGLSIKIGLF